MKYRILILTTLSLITLSTTWAAPDTKRKNVLSIKESITDNAIHYPSSFESDTKEMMESWYLRDFDFNSSYSTNTGTVSDRVYKERLQKLPTSIEMPFNQIVKSYIERYVVKGRTLVAQLVGMSSYYMPIFEAALERHNMPLELKYIPIIESALNPNAVSPAGAGGLWQFMPSTAKGIGMEVTSQVDARRDPYVSSEKAAVFFQKLYDTYGDWSLAIAAYNCGPGNVNKAMKRVGTEHPDFWEIYNYLPKETRGYVPAFIAANYVMTYYREHGINPKYPDRPLIIDTVQVNKRVSFSQISNVLKIPMDEIRVLNPQYRGDVIPGNVRPYTLALPSQQIMSFIEEEDKIYNYRRSNEGGGEDFLQDHEVKEGEDIFAIADMYSMKIDDLLTLNKLESEYDQLEPGTILKVMTTSSRRNKSQQGNLASTGNKQDYDDEKYINSGEDGDDKYNSSSDADDELSKLYNSTPTKKNNSGGYYGNNNYNDNDYNSNGHSGSDNRPVPERRKKSDSYNQESQYNSSRDSRYDNFDDDESEYSEEVYQQELKRQQEEAALKKREAEAKKKQDAELKKKREAEAKKKREAEAKKKREAEIAAKKKKEAELAEKKKREAEAKKKREEEERRRREAEKPISHKVKSGQNLTKLAQQYGTTPEAIRKANNIKGDNIREGQTLQIPRKK